MISNSVTYMCMKSATYDNFGLEMYKFDISVISEYHVSIIVAQAVFSFTSQDSCRWEKSHRAWWKAEKLDHKNCSPSTGATSITGCTYIALTNPDLYNDRLSYTGSNCIVFKFIT